MMTASVLDLSFLRTFVIGVELGSFARASVKVARSAAAVSTQMKRLEETVGAPLFRREGRLLVLTPSGEALYAKAKELLQLHDETIAFVKGSDIRGAVRLGLQEDFGELIVPQLLAQFESAYPQVELSVRVARNRDLEGLVRTAKLDAALVWGDVPSDLHGRRLARLRMRLIGNSTDRQRISDASGAIRLVLFDPPCVFREAVVTAIERKGLDWKCAYTSTSLGGLYSAVRAGLGMTVRTSLGLPSGLQVVAGRQAGLPALPEVSLSVIVGRQEQSPQVSRLIDDLSAALHSVANGETAVVTHRTTRR
jgi:DNA-binding transcriptional LysR family regulator